MSDDSQNTTDSKSANPTVKIDLIQLLESNPHLKPQDIANAIIALSTRNIDQLLRPALQLMSIAPRSSESASTPTIVVPSAVKRKSEERFGIESSTVKRRRNTDAARRCRLKKVVRMEQLEKQVDDLENEHSDLITHISVLETQKRLLYNQDLENQARIRVLEAQLSNALAKE